jgi:hypothetical protein
MIEPYRRIDRCRVSGSRDLVSVLNLGHQDLTGVFPKTADEAITTGPLELVWSPDSGLLQLAHSYNANEMYGQNYGYRSGLNASMVRHLTAKIRMLERAYSVRPGDTVLDIGSNDATSLRAYTKSGLHRIGIDPTGLKFKSFYGDDIALVPDFFTAEIYRKTGGAAPKVVTSLAMFYDLEDPIHFARDIRSIIAEDGVWHFEQSYMPSMLRLCSYDTICHEHIEYYSFSVVQRIADAADLKIIDVQFNAVNGGSFAVTAAPKSSEYRSNAPITNWLLEQEDRMGLGTPRPFRDFEERVYRHRADLIRLIQSINADGKTIVGLGASTKGNVMLQFCGFTAKDIPCIGEVNEDKFGRLTPGSHIPIVSEAEARAMNPDYFFVLPWHFKEGIVAREADFIAGGGKMIFPLPEIEIV